MAQVIITDQQAVAESWATWVQTIIVGSVIGLVYWLLSIVIGTYVIDPLACGRAFDAAVCADSAPLAGTIAAILAAVVGLIAMIRIGIARPIIIAVATAAVLWDLGAWTSGLFWLEAVAWSVILYAITFALFAWVIRFAGLWVTIALSILIVLVIRIAFVV